MKKDFDMIALAANRITAAPQREDGGNSPVHAKSARSAPPTKPVSTRPAPVLSLFVGEPELPSGKEELILGAGDRTWHLAMVGGSGQAASETQVPGGRSDASESMAAERCCDCPATRYGRGRTSINRATQCPYENSGCPYLDA